jgi:hypothetical protein
MRRISGMRYFDIKRGVIFLATESGCSLEEIDNKVKGLNKTLKASAEETREL